MSPPKVITGSSTVTVVEFTVVVVPFTVRLPLTDKFVNAPVLAVDAPIAAPFIEPPVIVILFEF